MFCMFIQEELCYIVIQGDSEFFIHQISKTKYVSWNFNILVFIGNPRINSGRTPWKVTYDPVRKYTLKEIQALASRYGIPYVAHKTIP